MSASRPVSRVLYGAVQQAELRVTAIPLGRSSPTASGDQPGRLPGDRLDGECRQRRPYSVLLPAGLAMPGTSPPQRCALTAPFHPYRISGGLLSVALSLGSPPPDLIRRRVSVEPGLSSALRQRPSGRLAPLRIGSGDDRVKESAAE